MATAVKPKLIEFAPGLYMDPARHTIDVQRRWLLLNDKGYEQIGLTAAQQRSLIRLFEDGKIKLCRITPRLALLDLNSWRAHLEKVGNDPWFWEDPKNLEGYRGTY